MARRIIRTFRLQYAVGDFLPLEKGQIIASDHEYIGNVFVIENSEPIDDELALVEPSPPESPEEIAADAQAEAEGANKDDLLAQARALGIAADGRWSIARIQAAIAAIPVIDP